MTGLRLTRRGKAVVVLAIFTFAVAVNVLLSGKNIDYTHGLPRLVEIGVRQ